MAEYTGPLSPPAGIPEDAIPITVYPNAGGGYGFGSTERGYGYGRPTVGLGPTLAEGYDRTINMTDHGDRLTPSFAAAIIQTFASPSKQSAIINWLDTNSPARPFAVILQGNDSYLFQNNSITKEANNMPSLAITAVADSAGIPSYTHTSNAGILTDDLVNIDSSTQPSFAYSAVANNGSGLCRYTTATNYLATGDVINISGSSVGAYNATSLTVTRISATTFDTAQTFSATATGTVTMTTKNYNGQNLVVVRVSDTVFTVAAQTFYGAATGNTQRESQYGNACLHDNGSGTAYLYAGLKTGARKILQRRSRTGTWEEDTAGNTAIFVASGGGKLWMTPTDYTIASVAADADPFTTPASAVAHVGQNTAKITSLNSIGGGPVAGKEDGVWTYNESDVRFNQDFPMPPSPDNCPTMKPDGAGGLWTEDADGQIIHIERFGQMYGVNPLQDKTPGRDTPRGRITDVAVRGNRIFALLDGGGRLSQPKGLCVLITTDNGATYTDYTDPMTDQRFDNLMALTGFDTIANGDWMLVGADSKIAALEFTMIANSTSNARVRVSAALAGAGTIATTQIIASGSVPGTLFDGTDVSPASTSTPFGKSGQMAMSHLVDFGTISWTAGYPTGFSQYDGKYWLIVGLV